MLIPEKSGFEKKYGFNESLLNFASPKLFAQSLRNIVHNMSSEEDDTLGEAIEMYISGFKFTPLKTANNE